MTGSPLFWALIGSIALMLLSGLVVRVVPEHQRSVVTRFGRAVRVDGPGVTFRFPGLERTSIISLRPRELQINISATTRDGVSVQLLAHAACRITEPSRAVTVVSDALESTVEALESRLQATIGQSDIRSILPLRRSLESEFPAIASEVTATWGVEVVEVTVLDMEARLDGNLLRSLDATPAPLCI
jgi:regulator of protease activity HflC (stomatin/prohibitin superfamily)